MSLGKKSQSPNQKVELLVKMRIIGWTKKGETEKEAKYRVLLEAEQRVNLVGDIRAHAMEILPGRSF